MWAADALFLCGSWASCFMLLCWLPNFILFKIAAACDSLSDSISYITWRCCWICPPTSYSAVVHWCVRASSVKTTSQQPVATNERNRVTRDTHLLLRRVGLAAARLGWQRPVRLQQHVRASCVSDDSRLFVVFCSLNNFRVKQSHENELAFISVVNWTHSRVCFGLGTGREFEYNVATAIVGFGDCRLRNWGYRYSNRLLLQWIQDVLGSLRADADAAAWRISNNVASRNQHVVI